MNINIENIKKMDENKIYEVLNSIFTSLYKDYDYMFTEEEFKLIVIDEIRNSKYSYLGNIEYNKYIKDIVINRVNEIVIAGLNSGKQVDVINNYKNKYKKSIYELMEGYSKEEIDLVLDKLSFYEKELLRLRYGEDLEKPVFGKLDENQKYKFYGVLIPKIKKMLNNENIDSTYKKSIYKLMEEYSKEEIDLVLGKLSLEEKELLRIRYGEDLENPVFGLLIGEQRLEFYNLIYRIRSMLKKRVVDTKFKKNIYNYIGNYSKEEIDLVLERLTQEEKELLEIRYGKDLNDPVFGKLTKKQHYVFYNILIPKIKRMLKYNGSDIQVKTIYELLNEYSKEEIDLVLERLTQEEKELLEVRYGKDLDNPVFSRFNKVQYYKFYKLLLIKIKRMLNKENFERINTIDFSDELKKTKIKKKTIR